jgi:hypothetical protein
MRLESRVVDDRPINGELAWRVPSRSSIWSWRSAGVVEHVVLEVSLASFPYPAGERLSKGRLKILMRIAGGQLNLPEAPFL